MSSGALGPRGFQPPVAMAHGSRMKEALGGGHTGHSMVPLSSPPVCPESPLRPPEKVSHLIDWRLPSVLPY